MATQYFSSQATAERTLCAFACEDVKNHLASLVWAYGAHDTKDMGLVSLWAIH